MNVGSDYVRVFNHNIRVLFRDALRMSLRDPGMALFLGRAIRCQNRAARTRATCKAQGLHVPPFMIASITKRCNLQCKGCYAQVHHRAVEDEMSGAKLRSVLREANDLGIAIVLLAGGEPLTRPEVLDIAADCPQMIFPLFTNGLLIDDEVIARFRKHRNIIPVISLEGLGEQTDERRGHGVYAHVRRVMERLCRAGVFFGTSLTVTSQNLSLITDESFVTDLVASGCKLFFYVDYVPVQPGTEELALSEEQRSLEAGLIASLRTKLAALFLAFPGDEEMYGGCLAAGRGFVHLSPDGHVEPCPFSPFSDTSLQQLPLREALQSPLLRAIRESSDQLHEARGGCALWEKREWVRSLLRPELVRP